MNKNALNHTVLKNRGSFGKRFADLAILDEKVFHADDLANLWVIPNKATLRTTLSRYVKRGLLHRIYKGMYSILPPSEINPEFLGIKALHGPAYISCETILFEKGIINQSPQVITLISSFSRRFNIAGRWYASRKMADRFLMNDTGIETNNGIRRASTARAIADMLYYLPTKYFDNPHIDRNAVRALIHAVGYPVTI